MYRERHYIVMDVGMQDVDRDDQYCHSALCDCRLAGAMTVFRRACSGVRIMSQ
jgi:hypothetical protein